MRQLLPGDTVWRNIRLATMDPQRQAPYGLVDNQALIVREGHICDIVPETQLPVSGDNIHDMQG
ncbi:imidazolonepropionase, partial [Salmonella enterica subsp. enterica serovar Enteritidis str. SE30663]